MRITRHRTITTGHACNSKGFLTLQLQLDLVRVALLLQVIMHDIYAASSAAAKEFGVTLAEGANIAGFEKVARAMLAQGAV